MNEGEVYEIRLADGEVLEGYTLYERNKDTLIVGYDGEQDDPSLKGSLGLRRIIRLSDVKEMLPVG